jgi:ribosome-binding protein aMBF1 (putative translation factor)
MPKKQCGICGRQIKGDYHWMTDERNKAGSAKRIASVTRSFVNFRRKEKKTVNVFRPESRLMVCSACGHSLEPSKDFDALTKNTGEMRLFCRGAVCQEAMNKLQGQRSGGKKRPVG